MITLWRYVIEYDGGSAPNYVPLPVTLAICKPGIRKGAVSGDLVIAFSGQKVSRKNGLTHDPHNVVWAGVVGEKLSFEQYWNDVRFLGKKLGGESKLPDNIYEPMGLGYRQVQDNGSHGPENKKTDLKGQYVLAFSVAWHFFPNAYCMPADLSWRWEGSYRRNHRRDLISISERDRLIEFLSNGPSVL